jgi:hypothetical protein
MTVKELRDALKGVPGNMQVAMADEMSVVFAEVVGGAFVVSDIGPDDDEPTEYWRVEEESNRQNLENLRSLIQTKLPREAAKHLISLVNECENGDDN